MKPSLKDQLAGVKLDFSTYAKLPIREDVLIFDGAKPGDKAPKPILQQWEKLQYLRNHLARLNRYIQSNKGETIGEWMKANNTGLSAMVLDKIGKHNDSTGGISAYFLNLQNFYDQEEQKYDDMESKAVIPSDIRGVIEEMRTKRGKKRSERREMRKIKLKDMKADGKGYLQFDVEEPTAPEAPAPAPASAPAVEAKTDEVVSEVKKTGRNVVIAIAGALIVVTGIAMFTGNKNG